MRKERKKGRRLFKLIGLVLGLWLLVRLVARDVPPDLAPLYPDFKPEDFEPELFEFETEDGVTLRGKRYPNPGATPVILMGGFMGNGFNYDVAYEECNFALYLARRGFDVWAANFRGTGRAPYKSECDGFGHGIEDIAVYDVPALVTGVSEATGMKPAIFGHSMGGTVSYGFLQGVEYVEEDGVKRLRPDRELAEKRNDQVAAVVSIAGPVCFRWPTHNKFYWMMASPPARLIFRGLRALVSRIVPLVAQVPVEQVVTAMFNFSPRLGYFLARIALDGYINMKNTNTAHFLETVLSGGSDVSTREVYQLFDALITHDFTEGSSLVDEGVRDPYNFSNGVGTITAPILFITGGRDAVDSQAVYEWGFQRVSSDVKDFKNFEDYGHIDLLMGQDAAGSVFPCVADWLEGVTRPA